MKNNPNFDLFKQMAKEILGDTTSGESLKQKASKVIAKTGETLLNETKKQIPTKKIEDSLTKLYGLVGSKEIADLISQQTQGLSPEELAAKLDVVKEKISDPQVAETIAKSIKSIAKDDDSIAQFTGILEGLVEKINNPQQQALGQIAIARLDGFLQMAKIMEEEDIAFTIQDAVENISTDFLAEQISMNSKAIDPDALSAALNQAIDKLPAPKAVSSVLDNAFDAAAKQVQKLAKGQKPSFDELKKDAINGVQKKRIDPKNPRKFGG